MVHLHKLQAVGVLITSSGQVGLKIDCPVGHLFDLVKPWFRHGLPAPIVVGESHGEHLAKIRRTKHTHKMHQT